MKHLFILALLLTTNAYATGDHGQQAGGNQAQAQSFIGQQSTAVKVATDATAISGAMVKDVSANSASEGGKGGDGGDAVNEGNRTTFNQVQQTPFAYAPGLAQSFSQDNCANTASIGVSAGFGAISGGAPVESDSCNRRKDVALWLVVGQNRIACERFTDDDKNKDAMKAAGMDCKALTEIKLPVQLPVNRGLTVYDKMDAIADKQIQFINKKLGK